jgi:hypothetical protein
MAARITRPEWLTDEEVDVIALRTHMALCEIGAVDGDPIKVKDPKRAYEFETTSAAFDKARRLALRSLGLDVRDGEIVRG